MSTVRNRTPILEIRAEAEFRAVRTDHSTAPLHSFIARSLFYSVVAFLGFCLYSPLRCPEHLRQYRLSFYCQELFASYSPFLLCLQLRLTSFSLALLFRASPLTPVVS